MWMSMCSLASMLWYAIQRYNIIVDTSACECLWVIFCSYVVVCMQLVLFKKNCNNVEET